MGKIVVWVIVIIVALMVMRIFASRAAGKNLPPRGQARPDGRTGGKGAPDPTLGASEPMVRCAHCGIFLPRSEALMQDGKTWCSHAHAKLGVRQH